MSRFAYVAIAFFFTGAALAISASPIQKPAKPSAGITPELLEARRDAARTVFQQNLERLKAAELPFDERHVRWSERWLDAELALHDKPADRIAALTANLERTQELEKLAASRVRTGQGPEVDALAARYYCLQAEIRLLEATRR